MHSGDPTLLSSMQSRFRQFQMLPDASPRSAVGSVSMVLPAYNEEANIPAAVQRADQALEATGLDSELIVVNDGSVDRTGEILQQLTRSFPRLKVIEHSPNRGYGGALRAGFASASREWIFQSDSDNQFEYLELLNLIAKAPGCDFVAGYRAPRQDPLVRRINAWGWNKLVQGLFGYAVRDVDCAFRLFRRSILDRVPLTSNGAMVSTELVVGAKARGYLIREIRATHLPREGGDPTGANITVILRALRDLVAFRVELSRQLAVEQLLSPSH